VPLPASDAKCLGFDASAAFAIPAVFNADSRVRNREPEVRCSCKPLVPVTNGFPESAKCTLDLRSPLMSNVIAACLHN
jgi:hypothetical protein